LLVLPGGASIESGTSADRRLWVEQTASGSRSVDATACLNFVRIDSRFRTGGQRSAGVPPALFQAGKPLSFRQEKKAGGTPAFRAKNAWLGRHEERLRSGH
jgi:hypothetical protein